MSPGEDSRVQFNAVPCKSLEMPICDVPGKSKRRYRRPGYSGRRCGAKQRHQDHNNAIDTDIITNYLKKSMDADVKLWSCPVQYEIRTNVTRNLLTLSWLLWWKGFHRRECLCSGINSRNSGRDQEGARLQAQPAGMQDKVRVVDNKYILLTWRNGCGHGQM